ncbi:hypothetical protein, partial [Bacillus licheniformis]|uniref:hypothetical protein n=1 Tax=Bacillus licheniformis TaxID=1402 RepID=UPI002281C837
ALINPALLSVARSTITFPSGPTRMFANFTKSAELIKPSVFAEANPYCGMFIRVGSYPGSNAVPLPILIDPSRIFPVWGSTILESVFCVFLKDATILGAFWTILPNVNFGDFNGSE